MTFHPPGVLGRIVAHKQQKIARLVQAADTAMLTDALAAAPKPRDFEAALRARAGAAIIAELKRRSPSAGSLVRKADAAQRALLYEQGGAAALSVLTDQEFFGGTLHDLTRARAAVELPVLCKDFIIDPLQLHLARAAGADAVLLIAAALEPIVLAEMFAQAREIGLTPLVEVHQADELEAVLGLEPPLLGVNNRDLTTLEVDLAQCLRLGPMIPAGPLLVAESGINTARDIERLRAGGFDAFLVGTALMRIAEPGELLGELRAAGGR
jgi:indole-3-glycerol phosphate synthase